MRARPYSLAMRSRARRNCAGIPGAAKAPTALLGQGDVAISGAGDYLTTVAKTLSPGWYAAAFAIEGTQYGLCLSKLHHTLAGVGGCLMEGFVSLGTEPR